MSTRITDLPQAEVLNGSEIMPLVQNGVTKKATLDFINLAAPAAAILAQTQQAYEDTVDVKEATDAVLVEAQSVLADTQNVLGQTVIVRNDTETLKLDFETQYLGPHASPPTLNNVGDPLENGALYWDTTLMAMFVWDGATWNQFSSAVSSVNGFIGGVVLDYADVGAAGPGANSNITSLSGITGEIATVTGLQLDTTTPAATAVGKLTWNVDDSTLGVGVSASGPVLQVGQEVYYRVKNGTLNPIANGSLVRMSGTEGSSGNLLVEMTIADGTYPSQTFLGVTTEPLGPGASGFAAFFGKVRGIDTTGTSVGEVWANGDILYASTTLTGGLTKVAPAAPNNKVMVALVVHAHPNGVLFVRPTYGRNLGDDELVQLDTLTDGDVLQYDATDGRFENRSLTDAGIEPLGAAAASIVAHIADPDPHPQYTTTAEASAAAPVQSVAGKTGAVSLVKADVGLSNVDNTSDAVKPVSTATAAALNLKFDKAGGSITGNTNLVVNSASEALRITQTGTGSALRVEDSANIDSTPFVVMADGNVGVKTAAPAVSFAVNASDAILVPIGSTANRPTGATGYFRFNTELTQFEGYNGTAWGAIGADDASTIDFQQAGTGAIVRTSQDKLREFVSVKDFGAVGDGVTDDTAAFKACFDFCVATKSTARIPTATYLFNGYINTTQGFSLSIAGDENEWPTLISDGLGSQPASTDYLFLLGSRTFDVAGLALSANILPNQTKIALTSVSGLAEGMMIHISSDRLWYNGNRGVYYCGEIHKISYVNTATKEITLEDMTRDHYETSQALTIGAWHPNFVSIKNLNLQVPMAAGTPNYVAIFTQHCDNPIISNVKATGFRSTLIGESLNWKSRYSNIHVWNDEASLSDQTEPRGYGIECNGSVGVLVDGLYSYGIRRAFDAGSIAGTTEAAIARDCVVTNFIVDGGGAQWPTTPAMLGYGIGSHGSCENLVVRDGIIRNCSNGITARGRNTKVSRVKFQGAFTTCVQLYEDGAGLTVENCEYETQNYPNKFGVLSGESTYSYADVFVSLGSVNSVCFYDLPVVITGNVCKGIVSAFVNQRMGNAYTLENLFVTNNYVEGVSTGADVFYLVTANSNSTPMARCLVANNTCKSIKNGLWAYVGTTLTVGFDPIPANKDRTVTLNGDFLVRLAKDSVAVIKSVTAPGRRIYLLINGDSQGAAFVCVVENSATLTAVGTGNSAAYVGNAAGSTMTGTTGIDGNVSLGLEANGDLYIENRLASATFVIHVLG